MDITPYKLEDAAFWANDDRGSDPLGRELVGEYRGVLVDAPLRVDIDRRRTLPAGLYHLGSIRELVAVKLVSFGIVTAMDVTRNRLYAASASRLQRDSDMIESEPQDPATLPDGDMSTVHAVDLRDMLELPWQPARCLVTVLLRGEASNRAAVELVRPSATPADLEAARQQDAARAASNPGPVWPAPSAPLPTYRRLPESPPIPMQNGINLALPRVVDVDRDPRWILYGAYRLTPLAEEMVKPGWADPYFAARPTDPKPPAVVVIALLLVGADDAGISLVQLRVPASGRVGESVIGYFAVDVAQIPGAPGRPQTYFLSAFSGEAMAGPLPTALVRM